MTEVEWLTCDDPLRMLGLLAGCAAERKLRLFTIASARLAWNHFTDNIMREAVVAAERCADGVSWAEELRQFCSAMHQLPLDRGEAAGANVFETWTHEELAAYFSVQKATAAGCGLQKLATSLGWPYTLVLTGAQQPALLRDIFGNPFRPVAFDPAWRTDTAVSLARTMYESREFYGMPHLADALQDAGCDSDAILSHCRDANQVHVRGCWVCDLVLGQE